MLQMYLKASKSNIHLLDRTETNIIFIWLGKVILGEAKPSPNITSPDQINMILGEVLSNKCFIIPAHVLCTRSIARFIDSDQEAVYQVACSAPPVQVCVLRHLFSNVEFYCVRTGYGVMKSSQFCLKRDERVNVNWQ